jgi:hypothetical protein
VTSRDEPARVLRSWPPGSATWLARPMGAKRARPRPGRARLFALGECLLSPTLPAITNNLAPPGAAGRYNGLGALAFTTGFLLGPADGAAALGAGQGTLLFAALALACAAAALAALRLNHHLPPGANQIPAATPATPAGAPATPAGHQPPQPGHQPPQPGHQPPASHQPSSPRRRPPGRTGSPDQNRPRSQPGNPTQPDLSTQPEPRARYGGFIPRSCGRRSTAPCARSCAAFGKCCYHSIFPTHFR